ncbi:MAG: N-acetylmuramoyl-L-alanine amidase [Desulfobacterales bacterium]|jgi:N-acetylmuramoyl-L-alanine amidase
MKSLFFKWLLCCFMALMFSTPSSAESSKNLYFQAEACYQQLKKNPQKRKYRHNWLVCIKKFQAVYKNDPDGPWATAGLYMTGTLYADLYRFSANPSDKKEALDNFERLVKRFPNSGYRKRAAKAVRRLSARQTAKKQRSTKKKDTETAKAKYYRAEACYLNLKREPREQKYRENWLRCIHKFQAVHDHDPSGPWAAAGLYNTGRLYHHLYQRSRNESDKNDALETFSLIIENHTKSAYRKRAVAAIRAIKKDEDQKVSRQGRKTSAGNNMQSQPGTSSRRSTDNEETPEAASQKSIVTGMRFWSNPNYTRIVIDADKDTTFTYNLLKRDPAKKKPQRLYVDLHNARLGENLAKIITIDDDLLSHARAGQFTPNSVRVVADIKSLDDYKVFSLKDPFRIVMDIRGAGDADSSSESESPHFKKNQKIPSKKLVKQLALRVNRIAIDPGHGGRDYGAPGYLKGVHEKKITLQIAKRLAVMIRKELKCEVILTRNSDRYLTLEERTAIANAKNADLFISIHTNANKNRRTYGISTYYLSPAEDDEAIRVAALENKTSAGNISDLQTILYSLLQNAKIDESILLGGYVQESITGHLKKKGYSRIKNQGVKKAPFYVLMGALMPAVLVETSFISNPRECKRLTNPKYQQRLCEGIVKGIKKYIREIQPTAITTERLPIGSKG